MMLGIRESRFAAYASLFTSVGTLVCCALPSLVVLLGFGATLASALSAAPWLVTLSRHKGWVFGGAAVMIGVSAYYVYRVAPRWTQQYATCTVEERAACEAASRFSRIGIQVSAALYGIGFFVAYVLGPILLRLEG